MRATPDAETVGVRRLRVVAARLDASRHRQTMLYTERARCYAALIRAGHSRQDVAALAGLDSESVAAAVKKLLPKAERDRMKGRPLAEVAAKASPEPPSTRDLALAERGVARLTARLEEIDRHIAGLTEQRSDLFRRLAGEGYTDAALARAAGVTSMVVAASRD